MIPVEYSTALVLYVMAYLGIVLLFWARYEWVRRSGHRSRRRDGKGEAGPEKSISNETRGV